ncbi:hypothetical protein LUZ60_006355 [Juncus effusus]|nr:hypothetical protein LUZ60_006355 [Juncus effusus]
MAPPPNQKRKRRSSSSPPSNNNASSLARLLESVLAMADPSIPLDLSLERILQSEKEKLVHVALRVGSSLVDAACRSSPKIATAHNSIVWPLPTDLTVKVLSFLDTTSLCYASATCTAFSKCASDPVCYANIDLTRNWTKVDDYVVSKMIQRAGKNLKSLELGSKSIMDSEGHWRDPPLTKSCLVPLSLDNGAYAALLQKLCLGRVLKMNTKKLMSALSYCKSLKDFEIFAVDAELEEILPTISTHCRSVERLCFDYSNFSHPPILFGSNWDGLIKNCKMITSISIIGCVSNDWVLRELFEGLTKLKYANFSGSIDLTGSFLKDLGNGNGGDCLETLILKDCPYLSSDEIRPFFNDVVAGKWKSLRFLDLTSNRAEYVVCGVRIFQYLKVCRPEIRLLAKRERENLSYMDDDTSQSGDEVSQNGDDESSDDEIVQNADDQIAQNGDEQNVDSSSGDEAH